LIFVFRAVSFGWLVEYNRKSETMHEVGIMQEAVRLAVEKAAASGGSRVHCLRLRVGKLSGVVPDSMRFAFDIVCLGTTAEGAQLEIEEVPARCWCERCQDEFPVGELLNECPQCHEFSNDLRGGRELEIASVEIS
jgi:hydrogenase nickel incorporation protein HypA/HybF